MTIRMGSLFTGLGGFDLAAEQVGMQIAWQCEIDKEANRVLERHWPEVTRYADITILDPSALAPVDLICGGFPCQDLSVAGRRAGLDGARSGLFWEFHRIVDHVRPRWIVLENVPGLLSSQRGRDLGAILGALGDLGYGWAYRVLDAQWAGVGQRRRRWFLVGCLGDRTRAAQILLEPEGVPGDPPSRHEPWTVAASLLGSGAGTSRPAGIGSEADFLVVATLTAGTGVKPPGRRSEDDVNVVTQALTATFANGGADDNKAQAGFLIPIQDVRGGTRDKTEGGQGIGIAESGSPMYTLNATEQHAVAYALRADPGGTGQGHNNTTYVVEDPYPLDIARIVTSHAPRYDGETDTLVAHTLRAAGADASEDGTGRGTPLVAATLKQRMRGATDEVMDNAVVQNMAVRRLMPVEAERLQGLPDGWTRWDADGNELSDSARYRLIGNAVAVPVVRWILTRIAEVAR